MKQLGLLFFSLLLVFPAIGQQYNTNGVWLNIAGTAGETYTKSVGSLSWSLGEAVVQSCDVGNAILTQGFCQVTELFTSVNSSENSFAISIYPNPVQTEFTIQIVDYREKLQAQIFSSTRQIVKTFEIDASIYQMNLNECEPGVYYIRILSNKPQTKLFVKK